MHLVYNGLNLYLFYEVESLDHILILLVVVVEVFYMDANLAQRQPVKIHQTNFSRHPCNSNYNELYFTAKNYIKTKKKIFLPISIWRRCRSKTIRCCILLLADNKWLKLWKNKSFFHPFFCYQRRLFYEVNILAVFA